MPRLIPPTYGNGFRPLDPDHAPGTVVTLDVSEDTHELVSKAHAAALDPDDKTGLLTGHTLIIGNRDDPLFVNVGGSTLHEAATEAIDCVTQQVPDMPPWVAGSDDALTEVVAEHFTVKGYHTCKYIGLDKVPS